MTKTYRQGQILKLIRARRISTQDELAQELGKQGIAATQVTLSRDIRDLRLVKTQEGYKEMAAEEPGIQFALPQGDGQVFRRHHARPQCESSARLIHQHPEPVHCAQAQRPRGTHERSRVWSIHHVEHPRLRR